MSHEPTPGSELQEIKEREDVILRRSTLMPVGVAMAIGTALFMGYLSFDARFKALETQIGELRVSVSKLTEKLDSMNSNRWTSQDQQIWALKVKLGNPTFNVPDVVEIIGQRSQGK